MSEILNFAMQIVGAVSMTALVVVAIYLWVQSYRGNK